MERVGVFYATREGQARKVAERVAAALTLRGLTVAVHEVRDEEAVAALDRSEATVLVASVHLGKHEREMTAFVRTHRARLDALPGAFLSVCGAEAGFENGVISEQRASAVKHVADQMHAFTEATGWHPRHVRPVAGAYVFTHYNPLVRWVMKKIAQYEGLPTDRDYEFTDWLALDDFARTLADELHEPHAGAASP